jgi:L-lactate dehydrogenase complex protein LldE
MPEISEKMVSDKLDSAVATGADVLLGGDLGCLMNIAGRARRLGQPLEVRHVAEVLAQDMDGPGIGEGEA